MSEKRIDLNLSAPDLASTLARERGEQAPQSMPMPQPDVRDETRFAAALTAEDGTKTDADVDDDADAQMNARLANDVPRPFALFGTRPAVPSAGVPAGVLMPLAESLGYAVERLMVGEGRSGNQVRMELKDELLPGVTVAIEAQEGRMQVDFFCRIERSRLLLNNALDAMAETLAQRLQRDVMMRVQTDDAEDRCLVERLAVI